MDRDLAVVADIVLSCREITRFTAGLDKEQFKANSLVRSGVYFQLQIIGEAAKRVSMAFREKHAAVPWKKMAGIRDRLIHGYDDINVDLVWEAITQSVPESLALLEPLLPKKEDMRS
jgi:uncharacterized protein with HEPN domain